jgi:septal ring factor EnvC (AmiA/AmiB activator)
MEGILASLVPTLLTAVLAWHTTRVRKDRDQLDEQRCERIKRLEEIVESHREELHQRELAIQAVRQESSSTAATVREIKEELSDIRSNMVRKDDLAESAEGLRQYIATVLKLTPHNRRR